MHALSKLTFVHNVIASCCHLSPHEETNYLGIIENIYIYNIEFSLYIVFKVLHPSGLKC